VSNEPARATRVFPQISVYLYDADLAEVERLAADEGKKRSEIVRDLVSEALIARGRKVA
jgi:metal-responsive CopG/Arc/MetJ family transcriptional regulator